MRSPVRSGIRPASALVLAASIALAWPALGSTPLQDDQQAEPTTLAELAEVYGVQDEPADVLIVVDTSSSMIEDGNPPPWASVEQGYDALVDSVGPHDNLGLITFDDGATTRLDLAPVDTTELKAQAKAQLPTVPQGGATDIGAGLEAAVDRLSRAGAPQLQTLVFITDGHHNPGPSSPYPSTTGPAWTALEERGRTLTETRQGQLYVFGWGAGGEGATDIGLVKRVFPSAQMLAIPTTQLPGYMASLATNVERARVKPSVQADLSAHIGTELQVDQPLQQEMTGSLLVTNPRDLATTVDVKGIRVTEADGSEVPATLAPEVFTLEPGDSKTIPVTLHPTNTEHGLVTIGVRTDARTWQAAVDASASLSPSLTSLLVNEQLATPQETVSPVAQPAPVDATGKHGKPWWWWALIAALLIALIALAIALYRWLFVPPDLSGDITDLDGNVLMKLAGKTKQLPNAQVPIGDTDDSVRLFTKPRGRGKKVWVQKTGGSPRRNESPLGVKEKRLVSQDRITIGSTTVKYRRIENSS